MVVELGGAGYCYEAGSVDPIKLVENPSSLRNCPDLFEISNTHLRSPHVTGE